MYLDENGRIHNDEEEPQKRFGSLKNKALANLINLGSAIRETNTKSEAYKNKTNAILGALTLLSGGIPSVTRYGASKLSPILGRKMGETIASGTSSGMVAGGVEGFGRGIIEERNPLETMALDAVIGTLGGGAISGAYGKGVQMVRGSRLRNFIISDKNLKELRKQENNYYKDYIQGTKTKRSDLGDISYTQAGLETVSKKPSAGRYFANLKKDIKTAKYIKEEQPSHIRNDDIIKFYRLEKENKEFLIAETPSGKKYYMSSMKKL